MKLVDANRRSRLISMMSLSSASMVFLFCLFALKVLVLQVSSCFATIHQSFDFCQSFFKRKKEASITANYHHISLSFVYLLTVCVCIREHMCTHLPCYMHIWRSTGQLLELVFSFSSGLQEPNCSHQAKQVLLKVRQLLVCPRGRIQSIRLAASVFTFWAISPPAPE